MAYVNTVAHHTASAARHAGDPVWIRHANRDHKIRAYPIYGLGDAAAPTSFDWGSLIKGVADVGKTVAEISLSKDDANSAKKIASQQTKAALASQAAALAEQKRVADAQLALQKQELDAKTSLWKTVLPWTVGGVLALGGGFLALKFLVRKKTKR